MVKTHTSSNGMSNSSIRKVWMNEALHEALEELAWQERITVSDVIRGLINEVAVDPTPEWLDTAKDVEGTVQRSVSVLVDNDDWLAARDATWPTRVSLAKQVRLRLIRMAARKGVVVGA